MNCLSAVSGGAISYIRNLLPLLSARFQASQGKHNIFYLAHEAQRELFSGVNDEYVYWIGGARPTGWRRLVWERRNLDRIVSETGADVVFTPYQVAALAKGVKQVLMLRNMEPFLFSQYRYSWNTALRNRLLARSSRQSLLRADRVIAVSYLARDHLISWLNITPDRIRTVYHGRPSMLNDRDDVQRDRSLLAELGVGERFVLTCGSLLPYRRCEDVIQAFEAIEYKLPEGMQLVIAGSGIDQHYSALIHKTIANATSSSRILLTGHVAWDKMKALYRQCDACVIATEIETCPNIAIEAMTAGCPIIANNKAPLPEMFDNAYHSYRSRDISDMAKGLEQVVNNKQRREVLRARSLMRAEHFSWEKCADETYAALTDWL